MRRFLIVLVLAGCSLGEPASPDPPPVPEPSPGYLSQRLRRLGSRELSQSIADLTGVTVPDALVAPLFMHRKYDNGDPDAWVTSDVLAAIEELAWFVADEVVRTRPARVWEGCDAADACRAHVLGTVLPRILRRDLFPHEETSYAKIWDDASKVDVSDAMRMVFASALQSPAFLYREEIGSVDPAAAVSLLEPLELATELSFLVTGSTPDDELLAAVRHGNLLDRDERLAQLDRLLRTPGAAAMERHFLELYFATAEVGEIRKSPKIYPAYDGGEKLATDFRGMLDAIAGAGGSTHELLTRGHRVGPALQARYSGGPPIEGVLMHPAFLATHGGFENSNPVGRGVFILTNLLCAPTLPPPAGIPRVPADKSPTTTTREKFAKHTEGGCQNCHRSIDGIGFGFEEFDGAGEFREHENGQVVDSSGVVFVDGETVEYRGIAALTARLATSQQVADCFAKQVVRFALGGGEREADLALYDSLARGGTPVTTYEDRLRKIVESDSFVQRRTR